MGTIVVTGAASTKFRNLTSVYSGNVITGTWSYERKIILGSSISGGTQDFWDNTNEFAELSDDISPELGNDLAVLNNVVLTQVPTSDHLASGVDAIVGIIKTGDGGRFILLYMGSDGEYTKADKNSYDTRCTHVSLTLIDGSTELLSQGVIRDDTWNWTVGGIMYLSITGTMTQDVSGFTTDDVVQIVGRALSADAVKFNPEPGGIEVA